MNTSLIVQQRRKRQAIQDSGHKKHGASSWMSYIPLAGGGGEEPTPTEAEERMLNVALEEDEKNMTARDWWLRTNGLDTVETWVKKYHDHPAGWGALLMMHGIPEVTGRLRSKVENFAVYSALFLATACAMLVAPPEKIIKCGGGIECEVRKRIYYYFLIVGVLAQVLCIALAMAFGNALNEAARDADVYRMFSPAGNGYRATKKCENAYLTGLAVTFVAVLATIHVYLGWELIIVSFICGSAAAFEYVRTSSALFSSAGIVEYWKNEKGGASDPYDLDVPVKAFDTQLKGIPLSEGVYKEKGPEKKNSNAFQTTPASRNLHAVAGENRKPEDKGRDSCTLCSAV